MTIRKGVDWGAPGPLATDAPVFDDERSVRAYVQSVIDVHGEGGLEGLEVGLTGGDLHRTIGAPSRPGRRLHSGAGVRYPVDVGVATLDAGGRELVFLCHLVAHPRRTPRLWSGRTVTVMNAQFLGPFDLAPRGHPNDGRLDVTDGSLPLRQRRPGRRRALSGTHVPHPDLEERRVSSLTLAFDRAMHVRVDGDHVGTARTLQLRCVPDALVVVA